MSVPDLRDHQIVVTGANGFFGSEIVRCLQAGGYSARATDIHHEPINPQVEYFPADILAPHGLSQVFQGAGGVIHTAGLAHVFDPRQVSSLPFHDVNAKGTANVVRAAIVADVHRLVLISSVSVYGSGHPYPNEDAPYHPQSPYAESKLKAEQYAAALTRSSSMSLTILRMATLYGEGDPGNVARLMRVIDRGRFIWIGDGSNRKSLIHRSDAAHAAVDALIGANKGVSVYNVSAQPCAMREVVEGLAAALEVKLPAWRVPAFLALAGGRLAELFGGRENSLQQTLHKWLADDAYDASRFERDFTFQTQVDLAEGLAREVAWYRSSLK